ncbi:hypothetical protein CY35_06G054400 [Sphagnum magellanicum]|nr:hypothetical protein CY35_06G054400 [Sphagnum magellanicum]
MYNIDLHDKNVIDDHNKQQFGCRRSATESGCVGMQLNKARDAGQKEEFFIGCIILACREIWYFIIKMLIYTHLEEFVQEC